MNVFFRIHLLIALFFSIAATCLAEDWPAFRGPRGDGHSKENRVPVTWDRETNVKWKVPLALPANGSPIVSNGRVFLTMPEDREGRGRSLHCFDRRNGRQLWVRSVTIDRAMPTHGANPYGGSTPAADGRRVVVWHGSAGLVCYDFDGNEQWRRDFGEFRHMWGYGTSPVLHGDRVILHTGPGERSFVAALDLRDGTTIWKADEPPAPEHAKKRLHGSWCTPLITSAADGRGQVICAHPLRVVAYDLEDGREMWWCAGLACERGNLAYSSPIVANDVCIVRGGYEGPEIAIRLGGSGDVTKTHRLWRHPEQPSNVGSGVVVDAHLYMPDENGHLACIEVATGHRVWSAHPDKGKMWGSIIYAAGRLYALNQRGTTVIFEPNPEQFTLVATNALGEKTNATPAVSEGEIILRTFERLYCVSARID
ncbi:MAG: serine/threonine protein kinase [Phycisphaeraceae bacterium]|nr:serine/threonine protein kinase [Phycisphaeraceae bacterium]